MTHTTSSPAPLCYSAAATSLLSLSVASVSSHESILLARVATAHLTLKKEEASGEETTEQRKEESWEHDVGRGGRRRDGADTDVEGAGEQQAPGAPAPGHRRQDLHRPPRARQLQAAQALRQQRGPQGAVPGGRMGRRGRWHHLPQGMQAAAGRGCGVGGDEPLLVVAAAERAVFELREPRAVVPRQPGVVELPEPNAAARQRQQHREPGGGVPDAPVPPWPAQPAAAPRLQQRARDAAALVADGGVAAAHQGPQARLGRRRRRPVPAPVLRRLGAGQPHTRPPARAPGHHPRVRRIRRLHGRLRPVDQLPDGGGDHGPRVAHVQPRQPRRRLHLQLHGARRRRQGQRRPGVRVRQGQGGHAVGRREDPRGRRRGARAHARRRRQVTRPPQPEQAPIFAVL